jgi:AmpD protein
VPSPNCDARPPDSTIDLIVVHGISLPPGQYGGPYITQLFANRLDPREHPYFAEIAGLKVSAHLLIRRDGAMIQYVPLDKRAWHAGRSEFQGRANCNDFSIGIELEGSDDVPFTDEQYAALGRLTMALREAYPIRGIAGHNDVSPQRKTDPGPCFDWVRYLAGLCKT